MKLALSPFERWMVERNLQYVKADGLATVINRLKAQGYNRVAAGVLKELRDRTTIKLESQ